MPFELITRLQICNVNRGLVLGSWPPNVQTLDHHSGRSWSCNCTMGSPRLWHRHERPTMTPCPLPRHANARPRFWWVVVMHSHAVRAHCLWPEHNVGPWCLSLVVVHSHAVWAPLSCQCTIMTRGDRGHVMCGY